VGRPHRCGHTTGNGTVKCWGRNNFGRLGLGDTDTRGDDQGEMGDNLPAVALGTGRTAVALTAGAEHACAVLDNGAVRCWGRNSSGRLGLGDTAARGDQTGEMGDSLPVVALGTGRTAVAIAGGDAHTCAVLDDASVKCWGENGFGRLGLGNTIDRGDQAGEMGDSLLPVNLGTGRTAVEIRSGDHHTCAVLDDATVKCWGRGQQGRLGLGNTTHRGDAPNEMGNSLPVVPLGTGHTALEVTAGAAHTCAILENGRVKCWGSNAQGRLGLGDNAHRGDQPGEMGDSLPEVEL
jgi:alpha-tubulin suppressor-like RCC1 family protein